MSCRTRPRRRLLFRVQAIIALASLALVYAHVAVDAQIAEVTGRIAQQPRDATLYLHRGELHRVHRDWEAARADYERARAINPAMSGVDLCLGRMLLESGHPDEAVTALDRFLSARHDSAEGFAFRARSLVKLGRNLEAAADYTRAIGLGADTGAPSDPDLYIERARALAVEGPTHAAEAIAGLDEGSARLGSPITLEMEAIDLETSLARYDAALERVDRLLARTPRKESWLCRRGEILESAGRPAEAHDAYASALRAIDGLPSARRGTRAVADLDRRIRAGLERVEVRK